MLEYFGFQEEPFGITPDPRFLFLSRTHRDALAALEFGFSSNRGFTALMAPPGMGKTTLLFRFLEDTRDTARTVFLFDMDALCEPREFVSYILRDIGINPGQTSAERHGQLSAALDKENRAGRKFVIVIDEAQNLSDAVLERVRLLTNFETSRGKLMHIVLSGQPLLAEKLMQPAHVQFRQRITTIRRIDPLSTEEIVPYIDYRVKLAGYEGMPLFTDGALKLIGEASQGTPRIINNVCFSALSLCQALNSKRVEGSMVVKVIADLQLIPPSREPIEIATNVAPQQPVEFERPFALKRPLAPVRRVAPVRFVALDQNLAPDRPVVSERPVATQQTVAPQQPLASDAPVELERPFMFGEIFGQSTESARSKPRKPLFKGLIPSTAGYAMIWVPAAILLGTGALGLFHSMGVRGPQPLPTGSSQSLLLKNQPASAPVPDAVTGTTETIQNPLPSGPVATVSVPPVDPGPKPLLTNSSLRKPSPSTRQTADPSLAPSTVKGSNPKLPPDAQPNVTLQENPSSQPTSPAAEANSATAQAGPASAAQSGSGADTPAAAKQVRPALAGIAPVAGHTPAAPNVRPALPGINP